MSKTAFVYPGQGAQKFGMGQDFYENSASAKELFDKASELLRFSKEQVAFYTGEGAEKIRCGDSCCGGRRN